MDRHSGERTAGSEAPAYNNPRMPAAIASCINIADLRRLAERRLPRAVFDYIDGGAEAEVTLRGNCQAFDDIYLRPRSAVAVPAIDTTTTVIGTTMSMPVILAPVGSSRLFCPRGECAAAAAAGAEGLTYTLSTLSGSRLEDVRSATGGPTWYQLYLIGGRDVAGAAIDRAKAAGYTALVVTIDTPVAGLRERDTRNGMKALIGGTWFEKLPYLPELLSHPAWLAGFFSDGGLMHFPNIVLPDGRPMPYADVGAALAQSVVTWRDFEWIRQRWQGPIIVKGVHTGDDARHAVAEGAAAVVVSNHGGRQLDGVAATLSVLPEVVDAVGGQTEVLLDGGIRRGSDIVKALSLGARAVLIGRAYAYGLAAGGRAGVARSIEILKTDLLRTMTLLGCGSVGSLDTSYVHVVHRR